MATVPAARNFFHNPRPASTTYIAVTGGGSARTLVTDRSYSGTSSIFATIVAGGTLQIDAVTAGDADITGSGAGGTWRAMFHTSGPLITGLTAKLRLTYTDATFDETTPIAVANATSRFERIILPDRTANAAKTVNLVSIIISNPTGGTITGYFGGFDGRHNQPLDAFISGASGPNYSWMSTVDNSPSNRATFTLAPVVGTGGSVYPAVRLYVVSRNNAVLREITSHFLDGDVTYDLDAETWKGSCRLILDDPGLIRPYAQEFVRIVLSLTYPDSTSEEGEIGHFMVDPPSERWSSGDDQWTYEGKDLLSVLATTMPPYLAHGYSAGVGYNAAFADVCVNYCGLTQSQFSFPATTGVITADITWEAGTSYLKILTDLLVMAGMQKPWVTPNGIITSAGAGTNPAVLPAAATFATGPNSDVRWPFQVDPDISGVANRAHIISSKHVANLDTSSPTLFANAVNQATAQDSVAEAEKKKKKNKKKHHGASPPPPPDPGDGGTSPPPPADPTDGYVTVSITLANRDPSHPLSFPNLGRYIDLPVITIAEVLDDATATAICNNALIQAGFLPIVARLTTRVMLRGLNEVYMLDLKDSHGNPIDSGQGKYFCRGWSLQLGLPFEMVHVLKRVVSFISTPFF